MKIVAIMPIKLNNERLPNKNVKLLSGKPLLQYELDTLKKTQLVDEIYVFCSHEDICNYLPVGVQFLKRAEELDSPKSNYTQIFSSFIEKVDSDIYVYAHATAPFVTVETMKACIQAVASGEYDSAFCAEKIQDYLWKDGVALNFDPANVPRSQDLPIIYRETSGIYVYTKKVFEQYHRRIGMKPYIREVSLKESIDINYPEDFELAKIMLDKL